MRVGIDLAMCIANYLQEHERGKTLPELANHFGVPESIIRLALKNLTERGFVYFSGNVFKMNRRYTRNGAPEHAKRRALPDCGSHLHVAGHEASWLGTVSDSMHDLWLNLCEHVWYELDAPQLIELVTQMNDLLAEEERRKQKLLLSLPRKRLARGI